MFQANVDYEATLDLYFTMTRKRMQQKTFRMEPQAASSMAKGTAQNFHMDVMNLQMGDV